MILQSTTIGKCVYFDDMNSSIYNH